MYDHLKRDLNSPVIVISGMKMMTKHLIFSFLILSSLSLQLTEACPKTPKIHIYIQNRLPQGSPPLQIHCWSNQGDDLGTRSYGMGELLTHDFCDTEFPTETIYRCQFTWNGRVKEFRIYRPDWDYHFSGTTVYLAVKSDGFYFGDTYPPASPMYKEINW